jgi:hypothetical protein
VTVVTSQLGRGSLQGCATMQATNQKHQTVILVTGVASDREYLLFGTNPSLKRRSSFVEGVMIDAVFNVAIFATLGLCIVGFSAWAHKRVP